MTTTAFFTARGKYVKWINTQKDMGCTDNLKWINVGKDRGHRDDVDG